MELVVFVVVLAGFGILAYCTGQDSRPNVRSREHDLARYGMTWPRPAPDEELATELRTSRMRRQCPGQTQTASVCQRTRVIPPVHAGIDLCH